MLNVIDFGAADDTLEEGRVALDRLEQQLRLRASNHTPDAQSETSSKLQSSVSRKKLDQLPRVARLNNRDESLGLTVEELDDRGLLDGGGSLPSYYSSLKQKNRRTLEFQSRSARLQERGKEVVSKVLNAVFHMLRTYQRWGVNVEEKFLLSDPKSTGFIPKKTFLSILKRIEMPLRQKEINDVVNNYLDSSSGKVDYQTMLKNGNISGHSFHQQNLFNGNSVTSPTNSARINIDNGKNVLREVKRMLLEAIKALNKNFDDLYRMFARWDTDGSGTVTATQFLRVLNRLRVDISDADQDFLVELLDTQGMGRIDFESLLAYCLMSNNSNDTDGSVTSSHMDLVPAYRRLHDGDGAILVDNDDVGGETVSAMSVDGNTSVDMKSNTTPLNGKRPSTASNGRLQPPKSPSGLFDSFDFSNTNTNTFVSTSNNVSNALNPVQRQKVRPMTALARVSSNQFSSHSSPNKKKLSSGKESEELELENLPDDVIHGEENYLAENTKSKQPQTLGSKVTAGEGNAMQVGIPSDQYDIMAPPTGISALSNPIARDQFSSDGANYPVDPAPTPSHMDHLILLASQILGTLRDIILVRYRRGRSLYEIYQHFDRAGRGYFDLHDFMRATADLRIETSERVAKLAIEIMAIDSKNFVTFGEFKVYALDQEHSTLIAEVQNQLGQLYERYGKGFENFLRNEVQSESVVEDDGENQELRMGILARDSFARVLKKVGLQLPTADLARLLDRFDIYGNDECYVDRFLIMLTQSDAWRQATRNLEYQSRAQQEANYVRSRGGLLDGSNAAVAKEVIDMCEYLGIGMLSEENMVWIAVDALRAPLPVNWTVQRDSEGRNYFYNVLTNQSRWEHPLDPHFRNLRDRYRQSGAEYADSNATRPWVATGGGINAIRDKRSSNTTSPTANDTGMWNTHATKQTEAVKNAAPVELTNAPNIHTKLLKSVSASSATQLSYHLTDQVDGDKANSSENEKIDRSISTKPASIPNPTFSYTGVQSNTPAIPKPVVSTLRGSSRPISAPMLYRPWQDSVKANQKAKVSSFLQEREAMVEAIYTAPYAGKKYLDASASARNIKASVPKAERDDRKSKLQEMYQEDIVERLGQVLR